MITHSKRLTILSSTLVLCVGCDQTTKYTAKELLSPDAIISLVYDTIRLQYTENEGAILGLGASLSEETRFWVFTVLVSLALTVMFFYLISSRTLALPPAIAVSLILAGGTSNLIDRLVYKGAVIDYLTIGIGSLRTGVFNVADVAIIVGAGLLVWFASFKGGSARSPSNPRPE
jgi:signal peptidase II